MKKALFLDRDGVINVDHGYVHEIEHFDFIDGIFDLIAAANRHDYLVLVVTNQAGIGRGLYSEDTFLALTKWMEEEMSRRGSIITKTYYCPHHPTAGIGKFKMDCSCRKPSPGMLKAAAEEFNLDMPASIMIGDRASDILAGKAANVGTLIMFGHGDPEAYSSMNLHRTASLMSAAALLEHRSTLSVTQS